MMSKEEIDKIRVTWKTLSYPEMKQKLQEMCECNDMSFLDMVSALYWSYIEKVQENVNITIEGLTAIYTPNELKEKLDNIANNWDRPNIVFREEAAKIIKEEK